MRKAAEENVAKGTGTFMEKSQAGLEKIKGTSRTSSIWQNRNFGLLWSGMFISSIGTRVSQLAFSLLVLAITGSPAQAGLTGALTTVPYFLLSIPAGALIDRWDRKRLMIFCDVGRGLCMASIPLALLLHNLSIIQLDLAALIDAILYVFSNIAQVSCIPNIVAEEHVSTAAGWIDSIANISPLLGSMLGGILYSLATFVPFVADALSYAFSALALLLIKVRFQSERHAQPRRLHIEMKEGLVWFWQQPLLRFMALYSGTNIATLVSVLPLVIIVMAQQQGASAAVTGLILACGGVGAGIGVLLSPRVAPLFSYGQVMIGIGWLWVLLWLAYALAPDPIVVGLITLGIFALLPLNSTVQVGYRLRFTPDEFQGRTNSIHRCIANGFKTLGLALTGVLLQWCGVVPTIVLIGGWFATFALIATVNPHMRRAD